MMKLKVVEDEKLKVLTCVRTHPEELLAPKIWFSSFLSSKGQECTLGPYDKIKKCSDCHPESSHMSKNSTFFAKFSAFFTTEFRGKSSNSDRWTKDIVLLTLTHWMISKRKFRSNCSFHEKQNVKQEKVPNIFPFYSELTPVEHLLFFQARVKRKETNCNGLATATVSSIALRMRNCLRAFSGRICSGLATNPSFIVAEQHLFGERKQKYHGNIFFTLSKKNQILLLRKKSERW